MTDLPPLSAGGQDPCWSVATSWNREHRALDESDAWIVMGLAAAQDRLWQLEYDRRRGAGRWAELAGPAALKADVLARRLRLMDAARSDISAMTELTLPIVRGSSLSS